MTTAKRVELYNLIQFIDMSYRDKDINEQYGLTVYIHHNKCHIFGKESAHMNRAVQAKLEQIAQKKAMKHYGWTVKDFTKIFGRNCIKE